MDIVAILGMMHDEDTDVGHRAEVHKVPNLVLKEPLVDQGEK